MTEFFQASLSLALVLALANATAASAQDRASYTEMMGAISKLEQETTRIRDSLHQRYKSKSDELMLRQKKALSSARRAAEGCDPAGYDQVIEKYSQQTRRDSNSYERRVSGNEVELEKLKVRHETFKVSVDRIWSRVESLGKERDDSIGFRAGTIQDQIDILLDEYYPMNAEYFGAVEKWRRLYYEANLDDLHLDHINRNIHWPERPKHDENGKCDFVKPGEQDKIDEEVRAACQDIQYEATYALQGGSIGLGGNWRRSAEAARYLYENYQTVMKERFDGQTYKFGQVSGFYTLTAYSAILEALECNMAVLRNAKYFSPFDLQHANTQACELRNNLASIIPEEGAAGRLNWKKVLVEIQEMDPCGKIK